MTLMLPMVMGISVVAAIAATSVAQAVTFSPISPAACPTMTEMAYAWDALDDRQGFEQSYIRTNGRIYHDNQTTERFFVTNPNLRSLGFRFTKRDFATNDYLILGQGAGTQTTVNGLSTTAYWASVASTSLATPVRMVFATNSSIGLTGFTTDKIRYCGVTPSTQHATITDSRRYQGVVLGTDDTVFMALPGAATNTKLNIVVWPGASPVADVDLYARCGALPTPTTYTTRSYHSGSEEFISISNAQCPSSSTLFIAVHSYSGSGGFNLFASRMKTTASKFLRAAVEGGTAGEHAVVMETLKVAARMLYGATDGQVLITQVNLVRVAAGSIANNMASCRSACQSQFGVNCDICFVGEDMAGLGEMPGTVRVGRTSVDLGWWAAPQTVYHEWGHGLLGVDDEYGAGFDSETPSLQNRNCGHSAMADSWQQQNFCMDYQYGNHNLDPQTATPEPQDSVWTEGLLLSTDPGVTPDWYDFRDHDMLGPTVLLY